MFLCFSLQGAVRLMRASLSVITSRIPMMTLTGRTSTHRKCRTSHQTSHKVRFEFFLLSLSSNSRWEKWKSKFAYIVFLFLAQSCNSFTSSQTEFHTHIHTLMAAAAMQGVNHFYTAASILLNQN